MGTALTIGACADVYLAFASGGGARKGEGARGVRQSEVDRAGALLRAMGMS